jgi:hypothetical protein
LDRSFWSRLGIATVASEALWKPSAQPAGVTNPEAEQEQCCHSHQDHRNQGSWQNRKAKKEGAYAPQQQQGDESQETGSDHEKDEGRWSTNRIGGCRG